MKPRNGTADEKLAIVMEGLKEKRSVAEICREHQIRQTLYYRRRDKCLEGGKKALVNGAEDAKIYPAEIERLQKIIGKQTIQIEILKKRRNCSGPSSGHRTAKGTGLHDPGGLHRPGSPPESLLCGPTAPADGDRFVAWCRCGVAGKDPGAQERSSLWGLSTGEGLVAAS